MSVNTTSKRSNFISNVVAQAQAAKYANDALAVLATEYSNQFGGGQSLVLVDADFTGTNSYMTAAQFATFFSAVQPALATAVSSNLQGLLAVLPQ